MNEDEINDIRKSKEFNGISFSSYKKSEVKKQLIESINNCKIEEACYWSAEFICAGHYLELWENILFISSKHIHLGNPKLPIYLNMRFSNFKDILHNGYSDNELQMRNNHKIRILFCEVICILCMSNKKPSFENIKIKKEEFDMISISSKIKAPNILFINDIYKNGDPKELFIPLNELAYHFKTKNTISCYYWIEWLIEFDNICRKKKEILKCDYREFANVPDKFKKDIIWIVWETIFLFSKSELITKILNNLLELFMIKYNFAMKKRRRYLLYFAVELVTEATDLTLNIVKDSATIENIKQKINVIYKTIKKNEVAPKTDYLFNNIESRSNLDKTIEKLDKLNSIINKK